MKKLIALLVCAALLLALLPTVALADDAQITPLASRLDYVGEDGNTYIYCVYEAEEGYAAPYFAALEYVGWSTEYDVTSFFVPAYVPYEDAQVPLRYISLPENSTFNYGSLSDLGGPLKDTVREVVLPATVERICRRSFMNFKQLQTITLPEGLKSIGNTAFFGAAALTELTLPSTLEELGEACFAGCSALSSANLEDTALREIPSRAFDSTGLTDVELPEGLTAVRSRAFYNSAVRWLSFPSSLQTLEATCFEDCKSLQTVRFAEHNDPAFKTINGFAGCAALTGIQIPDTVTTIADKAFYQCGLTSVVIPASVSLIENKAFEFCRDLASLIILPGVTPLTIGPLAFQYCTALADSTVILPARVTELQEGCFSCIWQNADGTAHSPTFYIYNDRLRLVDNEAYTQQNWEGGLPVVTGEGGETAPDPWFRCCWPDVYCPETMTEALSPSFLRYKALCEQNADGLDHPDFAAFDATQPRTFLVSGLAPEDAEITVASGGDLVAVTRTGRQFVAQAAANEPVTVSVSLDGYAERTFQKSGADFHADWDLGDLTLDSFSSLAQTGDLEIRVTGAQDANLAVLDAEGNLAASGRAEGTFFLAADLPAGTYTVLGVGDNPYVSAFSSEADLLAFGIRDYGKAEHVAVVSGEATACELNVPALDLGAGVLEKTGLLLRETQFAPGTEVTARINYKMAADHPAEKIDFQIPAGLTVVSVASQNRTYAAGTSIQPVAADRAEAVLSLTLRAEAAGNYTVSASVTSGSATVPLGSAKCTVKDLILDLPETFVHSRSVPVTVCAAPHTEVTLRAGTGEPRKVSTDARGLYRGVIDLPAYTPGGMRTAIVASTDETAVHRSAVMAPMQAQIDESYFIHAGQQIYGHQNGQNVSGGYYTYVANGDEKNKYWTYSVTFEGSLLTDAVILNIYMMDGSVRHETMSLASVENGETGYRQTYVCSVYLEQGGDHVFFPNLIPTGYDVTFTYLGRTFTMSADDVIYIRQLAAIDSEAWRDGVEQVISDGGLEPGDLDGIFDDGSLADEPWFDELPPDVQDAALQYEQAISDLLDTMVDLLGGEKDWADYDDADDFLEDVGIDYDENVPYDPEALADDGFTVSPPDADGNSFSFRETPRDDGGSKYEYRDSSGSSLTVDAHANALNNAGMSAAGFGVGKAAEAGANWALKRAGLTAEWLKNHPGAADKFGKLSNRGKAVGSVFGSIFGLIQAKDDSNDYVSAVEEYEKLKGDLENTRIYQNYYKTHNYPLECQWAIRDEIAAGERLLELLKSQKYHALTDVLVGAGLTVAGVIAALPSGGGSLAAVETINNAYTILSTMANVNRANWIVMKLADYVNAMNKRFQKCGTLKTRGDCSFATRMDPSGTVYEAVESNLLSGVTATCWDVTNDRVYDAAAFGEVNPQITGAEGFYAWDVPTGDWRVDFAKDGYENASTEVVTVPPPQMGLKTGMTAVAGPEIESIRAYPDCVEFVFTQYMDVEAALTVPEGYTAVWVDPTPVSEGSETAFATVLRLVPETAAQVGDKISVSLDGAKNYAGKPLAAYEGSLTVEVRPASLELNYETEVAVLLNETPVPRLTVRVLDGEGKPLPGRTVLASGFDPRFAAVTAVNETTDETGTAVFAVEGLLPGLTDLTLTVEGSSLSATLPLRITAETNQVARPTATVGETVISAGAPKDNYLTVPEGTVLTLACETDGATIYYTLNDTCPCQNTENRIAYTGPITLTESGYYRISAYKPGMEYSERLNLHVTVGDPCAGFDDVERESWYHAAADFAIQSGFMGSTSQTELHFEPYTKVSRAMVASILYRICGAPADVEFKGTFTDVKQGAWYATAVEWCAQNGLASGKGDGIFDPDGLVTRQELAVFMYKLAAYREQDVSKTADLTTFPDGNTVPAWALDYVKWAVAVGLITGKGQADGTTLLAPVDTAMRCELASILQRFLNA